MNDLKPTGELVFDHAHLAVQAAMQGVGVALGIPALLDDAIASGLLTMPFADRLIHEKAFYWILPEWSERGADAIAFCEWLEASGAAVRNP